MTFDEAIEQAVAQGAIRAYRLSDSLAYVYRLREGAYQARGLYAADGEWRLGDRLVSARVLTSADGWFELPALPWQAQAIELEAAMQNPGYGLAIMQQCYTCKENKPILAFERSNKSTSTHRQWECNQCNQRRMREMANYRKAGALRQGDDLSTATIASPPPPEGEI